MWIGKHNLGLVKSEDLMNTVLHSNLYMYRCYGFYYAGDDKSAGFLIHKRYKKKLYLKKVICLGLKRNTTYKINIITQAYAPTTSYDDEEVNMF